MNIKSNYLNEDQRGLFDIIFIKIKKKSNTKIQLLGRYDSVLLFIVLNLPLTHNIHNNFIIIDIDLSKFLILNCVLNYPKILNRSLVRSYDILQS